MVVVEQPQGSASLWQSAIDWKSLKGALFTLVFSDTIVTAVD
jgi:hypothetical protein